MSQLKADERLDRLMRYDLDIIQSPSVFSFSIDALLLDDFTYIPSHKRARIVDLCSGNGVLALTLSQRTQSPIYAVEIQPRLVDMAQRSIELNGLDQQIHMIESPLKDSFDYIEADSVDVITCNPPYFEWQAQSRKNPNSHLAIARHEIHTDLEQVIQVTSRLLKMKGRAFFVYRPARLIEMIDLFRAYRLMPKKLRLVYPKGDSEANMILIEVIKDGKERGLKILPPLFVHDSTGQYMKEIRDIIYGDL